MEAYLTYVLNGLSQGAIYALIAVGYTMVYGVLKLINFAHGEFYMIGAFVGYAVLWGVFGVPPDGGQPGVFVFLASTLLAGLMTGLVAVIIERACYRPLRNASRVVALLSALGVSLFLQNAGQQTVGASYRKFPPTVEQAQYPRSEIQLDTLKAGEPAPANLVLVYYVKAPDGRPQQRVTTVAQYGSALDETLLKQAHENAAKSVLPAHVYTQNSLSVSLKQLWILLLLVVIAAGLFWIVQHTRFGRAMRAVSVDFEAARLMGINVNNVVAKTFFIGAFVAGVGGVLSGGMYYERIDPLMGSMPSLKAFVAAVLGGIGSIPGALLGGLILGVFEQLIQASSFAGIRDALSFGILIVVLLVMPGGLFGKFEGDKV